MDETFRTRLRATREAAAIPGRTLGTTAGLSPASVSALETGAGDGAGVAAGTVAALARAFGALGVEVTPEWLAWGRGPGPGDAAG